MSYNWPVIELRVKYKGNLALEPVLSKAIITASIPGPTSRNRHHIWVLKFLVAAFLKIKRNKINFTNIFYLTPLMLK